VVRRIRRCAGALAATKSRCKDDYSFLVGPQVPMGELPVSPLHRLRAAAIGQTAYF